jgi:hypothetical protein
MIDLTLDIKAKDLICLPETFFVKNLELGQRKTSSGIYIPEENMKLNQRFIKPRWCQVYKKADDITDFEVGDWLLLKHGHWSTALNIIVGGEKVKIWYITPKNRKKGILAISKQQPKQLKDYEEA